jgi:murein L,D-transpeptidase YcbB/YkuD
VLYATAVADADGTVSFYPDLYKHDALLEQALGLTPIATPR